MIKFGEANKWISNLPKENELKRLTIDELIQLAKRKRSVKYPLKKMLIEYILEINK